MSSSTPDDGAGKWHRRQFPLHASPLAAPSPTVCRGAPRTSIESPHGLTGENGISRPSGTLSEVAGDDGFGHPFSALFITREDRILAS